jgi:hypothetical protein
MDVGAIDAAAQHGELEVILTNFGNEPQTANSR